MLLLISYFAFQKKLSYKNTKIHRIVPDFVIQMGDITTGDGTGGENYSKLIHWCILGLIHLVRLIHLANIQCKKHSIHSTQ